MSTKHQIIVFFILFGFSLLLGIRLGSENGGARLFTSQERMKASFGAASESNDLSAPDFQAITIASNLLASEQDSRENSVSYDGARIPERFWRRKVLNTLSENLELSDEAKEFFDLSEEKSFAITELLASKISDVTESESHTFESRIHEDFVLVKVPASRMDTDEELDKLAGQLAEYFPSLNDARFFVAQSENDIAAKTGEFGTKPRLIRVDRRKDGHGYVALIYTGGDVGSLNFEEIEEHFKENRHISGSSSTMLFFSKLPQYLEHIFEDTAPITDPAN